MNLIILLLIVLSIVAVVLSSSLLSSSEVIPSIWPQPNVFKYGERSSSVSSSLSFKTVNGDVTTLEKAYQRYSNNMFKHSVNTDSNANIKEVLVHVTDNDESYPQLDTDESYELIINDKIIINSRTVYGALRALESLSQLVMYDFDTKSYQIVGLPILIEDAPRYKHRGLLLDTSRHFQPVDFIKRTIDGISYAKLNVFHWHVVDTQSFPFQSLTFPKLWDGAFTKAERYSREDVIDIVEYGRLRGIKVMIELDIPGHAGSWCKGYPEICPSTTCLQPLNPSNEETFKLISSLLGECTGNEKGKGIFPYDFLHLGGDEVDYTCWEESAEILAWEQTMNFNGSEAVYEYFVDRAATIARSQARTPVQWVEVYEHFTNKLSNDTVVHVWKEKETMTKVIMDGYRTILSDQDVWYLDHLNVSWESFYLNEPTAELPDDANANLILGGEACMWGETVDPSDVDATIFPRVAAFAERMWTSQAIILPESTFWLPNNHDAIEDRLEQFRCLLQERAIGAAPVRNQKAREAPPKPGSCFVQRRK